jgi:hypothetical protein
MSEQNPQSMLEDMLRPWEEAVADPARAQEAVLRELLAGYARTQHGGEELPGSDL